MKQDKVKYDFKAFGQAIKEARKAKGISRNQLADRLNIAPRYIASIENSGQHPSLQIFYELVTFLDVSVDQFFFPVKTPDIIDANDNTPVLDIKPYTPSFDRVETPGVPVWCSEWPKSTEASGCFNWEQVFNF